MNIAENRFQCGRSMIEMLGVLAIVGILSVGGIATFHKVMVKHRVNKWAEEVSIVFQNFLQYKKDWMKMAKNNGGNATAVSPYVKRAGLVPETWMLEDNHFRDSLGNYIGTNSYPNQVFTNIRIYNDSKKFEEVCLRAWTNIIIPYSEAIYMVHNYGTTPDGGRGEQTRYFGDAYCVSEKYCIRSLKISDIVAKCAKIKDDSYMTLSIYFK